MMTSRQVDRAKARTFSKRYKSKPECTVRRVIHLTMKRHKSDRAPMVPTPRRNVRQAMRAGGTR